MAGELLKQDQISISHINFPAVREANIMSETKEMNEPLVCGVGNCVAWGGIAALVAWYFGATDLKLALIALGAGIPIGFFMYAMKKQEVNARPKFDERTARQLFNQMAQAAAAQAAREPQPELSAADMELVEKLVQAHPGYLPRREGVVREVGRELNARGGNKLMLAAHAAVRARLGGVAARELEMAWDGIGEWMG